MKKRIVLDTNCLLSSLSRQSESYDVWRGLHEGRYTLCVSNSILEEYQEKIAEKTTPEIAVELIKADPDDNKFVDCAIAANATYIVSDDKHFAPFKDITFPQLLVIRLMEFVKMLQS